VESPHGCASPGTPAPLKVPSRNGMALAALKINLRLSLVIFLAVAISLPIALVSVGKALLFVTALAYLLKDLALKRPSVYLAPLHTILVILLAMLLWGASLSWTGANIEDALTAFVKHGKLVMIPILVYLVRTRREAEWSVAALLAGQMLTLLSSWLMAFDFPLPWVMRASGPADPLTQYVPYADSYLDQSIMLATTSGLLWQLGSRHPSLGGWSKWLAIAGLANVLVLMPGRTGYLLAIIAICLAAVFEIPAKLRLVASMTIPILLGLALFFALPQFQQRVGQAVQELGSYQSEPDVHSSVGARLNMWKLSLQAIAGEPLTGYGIGNWTPVIKRLYGDQGNELFGEGNGSNPHQELLLWTVELGVAGALLFLALLYSLFSDTRAFEQTTQRSVRSVAVMLLIACMFNSPLYDDLLGDYFCVVFGLLLAMGLRDNRENLVSH
jgi:O-antigen ligase